MNRWATATRNSYPNDGAGGKSVSTENEGAIGGIVPRTAATGGGAAMR